MKAVTIPLANTNYNLLALMQVVDPRAPVTCMALQIEFDPDAGSARLRLTNSDGSNTNWGVQLVASQAFEVSASGTNSVPVGNYWLRCDTAGQIVGIFALVT
jgi:hypothetical protein